MFSLFECPECHRIHDEPAEPAYTLAVRCLDCALHVALFERRIEAHEFSKAA